MLVADYGTRRYDLASASFVLDFGAHCNRSGEKEIIDGLASFYTNGKQFPMTIPETPEIKIRISKLLTTSRSLQLRYERIINPQAGAIIGPFKHIASESEITGNLFRDVLNGCIYSSILQKLNCRELVSLASTSKWFRDTIHPSGLVYARERFECEIVRPSISECRGMLRVFTYDEEYITFHLACKVKPKIGLEYRGRFYFVKKDIIFRRIVTAE